MKIKQIRYFGYNNYFSQYNLDSNYPSNLIKKNDFEIGAPGGKQTFTINSQTISIEKLTINSLPGIEFFINNNSISNIIGISGVYEIDNLNAPLSITFTSQSIEQINENPDGYLIIDIIYGEE